MPKPSSVYFLIEWCNGYKWMRPLSHKEDSASSDDGLAI